MILYSVSSMKTYQRDGRLVQQVLPHLVHSFRVARDADIGDESREGATLHTRHRLGLRRRDSRVQSISASITHLLTQASQVIDIARVHRQSMDRHVVGGAIRVCPFLEGTQTAVKHIFPVRAGQIRVEGHVEGDVDEAAARHGRVRAH